MKREKKDIDANDVSYDNNNENNINGDNINKKNYNPDNDYSNNYSGGGISSMIDYILMYW